MNVDFHIHTTFSDGTLPPEELIQECIKRDMKKVGISDHWGTSKYSEKFQVTDIFAYKEELTRLRNKFPQLEIYIGLEVDFSNVYGVSPETYDYDALNQVEYLLFEHVNTDEVEGNAVNGRKLEELISIRKNFKIPVGLAHNHFQHNFPDIEQAIIKMKENDIFLEICEAEDKGKKVVDKILLQQMMEIRKNFNSAFEVASMLEKLKAEKGNSAVRKKHAEDNRYFFEHFEERTWEMIRAYGLKISVSSDSHKGLEIGKSSITEKYLKKYDLEKQLIFS